MATPALSKHRVPGALGDILVDVRAAGREAPRPAVVVVHGYKGFKDWGMFPPFAERLARAGFTAVTLNLSGSGVDEAGTFSAIDRFGRNTFSAELGDVGRVLDALSAGELGSAAPTSVGLVGHSRGGAVAILQAARDLRIGALVTWAAISTVERWSEAEVAAWRATGTRMERNTRTGQELPMTTAILDDIDTNGAALDIQAAAARVKAPWLLIHGAADESVRPAEGHRLRAAAPAETRFLPVPGAGHTFGAAHPWRGDTPELRQVFDASLSWLIAHLG